MSSARYPAVSHPAYRSGALTLFLAAAAIGAALVLERVGYSPCPLCLQQRWAYYAGIPALFLALALYAAEYRTAAAIVFSAVALAFLANAGLGIYHAGVEWKFWPGPATCAAGTLQPLAPTPKGGILQQLESTRVIRCDEAPLHIFGLSLAGWNVVVSLLAFALALKAAISAVQR